MMMFLYISCNVANPINHPQSRKNLGRSGYKPVELPFDPFLASNLAICWDPDKFEPEAKLSTCGVLDDFGIFFTKIMTFLKWEIGTQHLGEPSGFEGYDSKVEYG